jgi:hypothetical protein
LLVFMHPWTLAKRYCTKYAQSMHKVCTNLENMHKICTKYALLVKNIAYFVHIFVYLILF